MEMQFERIPVDYLQPIVSQLRTQEQTLEVRLPDGMPDIGRVLGAWGQVIVRGKEWNGDNMTVNCGMMVWVLYTPEDGGVRSVEAWLPFSMKWELPDSRYDGKILVSCLLKGVDARSTSARKLMVRANISAMGEAWLPGQGQLAMASQLPEDIEVLKAEYPVLLPKEAGEKSFSMEEQLELPDGSAPEKLLYYSLQPQIEDKKVMSDKVVFRGSSFLHILCRGAEGKLLAADYELPFSQYCELDGAYEQSATVSVLPGVTSLDVAIEEDGKLSVKAGLTGQYLVSEQSMISVIEDAYSPRRQVTPQFEQLLLPAILDQTVQNIRAEETVQLDLGQAVDVTFHPCMGQMESTETGMRLPLQGQFQTLYYDPEGELRSMQSMWEGLWSQNAARDTQTGVWLTPDGMPTQIPGTDTVQLRGDMTAESITLSGQGIRVVTGLEMGEMEKPDSDRPSLILCRKGDRRLWDVAKTAGSTVETILQANHLETEPDADQILLIPVV